VYSHKQREIYYTYGRSVFGLLRT